MHLVSRRHTLAAQDSGTVGLIAPARLGILGDIQGCLQRKCLQLALALAEIAETASSVRRWDVNAGKCTCRVD